LIKIISFKRALSNPNLTSLKSSGSFDVTYRTVKTPKRYPKNQTSWIPDKTKSLPNLSEIYYDLMDKVARNCR